MSRIGQKPVDILSGVTVSVTGTRVTVKGAQGELLLDLPPGISAEVKDGKVNLRRPDDLRTSKSFHGLSRTLVANMIDGVSKGFSKELEIQGVGFKAALQGQTLSLSLGFASPVEFAVPKDVKVTVDAGINLVVRGPDKQRVGDTAAQIRSFYPAEPYKGKGIRYKGEYVRRKVGKTVA